MKEYTTWLIKRTDETIHPFLVASLSNWVLSKPEFLTPQYDYDMLRCGRAYKGWIATRVDDRKRPAQKQKCIKSWEVRSIERPHEVYRTRMLAKWVEWRDDLFDVPKIASNALIAGKLYDGWFAIPLNEDGKSISMKRKIDFRLWEITREDGTGRTYLTWDLTEWVYKRKDIFGQTGMAVDALSHGCACKGWIAYELFIRER